MSSYLPNDEDQIATNALSSFCCLYEPATDKEITDTFSSAEIAALIKAHTGFEFLLSDMNDSLKKMGYKFELLDGKFVWLCNKVI